MHIPGWVYKALAAIGGGGFLAQSVGKPLLIWLFQQYANKRDEPIWAIVRAPQYQRIGTQNNWTYDSQREIPYTVAEIAERAGRKPSSVLKSLHHLEKMGKVKDVHGGWQRKL